MSSTSVSESGSGRLLTSRMAWLGLPDYLRQQNLQFWLLQGLGWSGWAASWIASGIYWGMEPAYNLAVLVGMLTGLLLTGLLRELYRAIWNHPLLGRLVICLLASYVTAALWQVSKNVALLEFYWPFLDMDAFLGQGWSGYFRGTLPSFYIILCWSGLYFGIKSYRMLLVERDRALAAIGTAREAQLRMLRYQLNPHFLFNTLNAISTLILAQEGRKADQMLQRLASFLRHSLDNDPTQSLTLREELEVLRMYLDIEQVRFEDRLQLLIEVEAEAERALLPGLLLQPLVENAIKHAIAGREDGGRIALRGRVREGWLEIEVEDDGPGLHPGFSVERHGAGIGLANIRERLRQAHGQQHQLKLDQGEWGGLKVHLRLPFVAQGRPAEKESIRG